MTAEQLLRWSTRKADGTFPYPWYRESDDSYLFEVADFPTPEDCMAFAIHEWGRPEGEFGTGGYDITGPVEGPVHLHDEDTPCQPDAARCAKVAWPLCWVAEPSFQDEPAWAVVTDGVRTVLEMSPAPPDEAPSLELGLTDG